MTTNYTVVDSKALQAKPASYFLHAVRWAIHVSSVKNCTLLFEQNLKHSLIPYKTQLL